MCILLCLLRLSMVTIRKTSVPSEATLSVGTKFLSEAAERRTPNGKTISSVRNSFFEE